MKDWIVKYLDMYGDPIFTKTYKNLTWLEVNNVAIHESPISRHIEDIKIEEDGKEDKGN